MNRTGIPTLMGFNNGGDVENEQDVTDTGGISSFLNSPSVRNELARQMRFQNIRQTLDSISPPIRQMTGYDLASELY